MKVGLMDWGMGGIGVYRALREQGSRADVAYFSDSGFTPYGKLSRPDMLARFEDVARFFTARGVTDVFVACNAASSALEDASYVTQSVRFLSIVPYTVRAALTTRAKKIGVIGGRLTISSGVYQRALGTERFIFAAAQPLSAFVEAGQLEGAEVNDAVANVLKELGDGIDALVLACTHYPALTRTFRALAAHVELIDPAALMAADAPSEGSDTFEFFTTGSFEDSIRSARLAFGVEISP